MRVHGKGQHSLLWAAGMFVGVTVMTSAQSWAQESPAPENSPAANTEPAADSAQAATPVEAETAATIPVESKSETIATKNVEPASDDAVKLDEIQVTASKRAQSLSQVAGSVNAVRGEDLEKIKAQSLSDYLKLIPGVVLIDRGGADVSTPVIRGITTDAGELGTQFTQQPVGIYVDDLPLTDLYAPLSQPDLNPFDLERVEILKGPQGTLFGSGALAGAIRYILQKPKLATWETKLSATVTSSAQGEGLSPVYAGAVNIPLYRDAAALRIVGLSRRTTGSFDEIDAMSGARDKDVDRIKQDTGRALASWQATDRLKFDGFYFRQLSTQNSFPGSDNPERFERVRLGANFRQSSFSGANLGVGYAFDASRVQYTVSLIRKHTFNLATSGVGTGDQANPPSSDNPSDQGPNGTGTEVAGQNDTVHAPLVSNTRDVFQEVRLSSPDGGDWRPFSWLGVQWLLGGAYQNDVQGFEQSQDAALVKDAFVPVDNSGLLPLFTPIGPITGSSNVSILHAALTGVAKELAIYGETTATLFDDFELTLGARAFRTSLHTKGFIEGAETTGLDAGKTRSPVDETVTSKGVNPKASLRYVVNRHLQVYTLAAKGFQFGGVQLTPPLSTIGLTSAARGYTPYKSSTLWNYELGLRTEFFERRLKWDVTGFYLDWKDLQITVPVELVPGGERFGLSIAFTENVGHAASRGVETALSVSPLRGLSFTTSAAWVSALTTEDFQSSQGFVPKGTRLPGSPRFQIANVVSYATPFSFLGEWEGGIALTHAHIGGAHNSLQYATPSANTRVQGDYDTFDARFNLTKPGLRLVPDLTLSMLNLTDQRGAAAVSSSPRGRTANYYFITPRTLLASVTLKF